MRAIPSELVDPIEEAYRVFSPYRIGSDLVVCRDCCMSEETERKLVATPLRAIPSALLAEYTDFAHGYNDGRIADELRYFLPRYFELIAADDPPDHTMGLDICLRRLGGADYRDKWPRAEADAIDRFFDAFLVASLSRLELAEWPAGWRLDFKLQDVLTMAVTAGGDVDRLLRAWAGAADPPAAIHMAALRRDVLGDRDQASFYSAYLEDHADAANKIGAWLMDYSVTERIEAAFFEVSDERLQKILSDAVPGGVEQAN